MLSVVMPGRNDQYGYKNPERTQFCLNSWGRVLVPEDEILFVDFASPNGDLPSQLALSPETRSLLRVIKVNTDRIQQEELRWGDKAQVSLLEPQARNIGIRAAKHPWVLSTNSDIVPLTIYPFLNFLDPKQWYLSQPFLAEEAVWEVCGEKVPLLASQVRSLTQNNQDPNIPHGKVGDFQLATRRQWEAIRGFEEKMGFLWGHSDSNVCIKLARLYGPPQVISPLLPIIHLNHNSSGSNWHDSPHNDWPTWVTNFKETLNGDDWGVL